MEIKSTTFYCFSPPVMLATLLIEAIGALYILWRYKMTAISRLVVAILVCLATFQGAEYMLCGGMGIQGGTWSQLGYSAITILPPLGLHLSRAIAGKKANYMIYLAYASAVVFTGYFAFITSAISGHTCYANYAVFDTSQGFIPSLTYAMYYYGWLFAGIWASVRLAGDAIDKRIRTALYALAIGYSAFIVPTTLINIIDPSTISGIPSIMCGFAVILAVVLVTKVAPESLKTRDSRKLFQFKLPF